MVYIFLADGFEEIEAISVIDILQRAEIQVKTVGILKKELVGAHNIKIIADILEKDILPSEIEAMVLPGGMPGTLNLEKSTSVIGAIKYCLENNKYIAAICAAPSILGHIGALKNKNATCFNGFEDELLGAYLSDTPVCVDGKIITAKSAWFAMDFALEIVKKLKTEQLAYKIKRSLQCM